MDSILTLWSPLALASVKLNTSDYDPLRGSDTHLMSPVAPIGNFESDRPKVLSNHLPVIIFNGFIFCVF